MRFTEVDLFGVYVAPISLMMVAAWLILIALRRAADHFGLLRHVWHPALFVFAVYLITLSSIVLILARRVLLLRRDTGQPENSLKRSGERWSTS